MNRQLLAFLDELDHIGFEKKAWMRDLGAKARAMSSGVVENAGNTLGSFATPISSFKHGLKETLTPGGKPLHPGWKAFMAYGLASGGYQAMKKEDPLGTGRSRLQRTMQLVGDQVGGVMGAPYGFTGGVVGSLAGGAIGSAAGKLADKVRGYKPRPRPAAQTLTQVGPLVVPK